MTKSIILFTLLLGLFSCAHKTGASYPESWWQEVSRTDAKDWEVLPQDANPGEVILSKRTDLGVFSNLAHTPFKLDDVKYNSVEGLWQGMKYPDPDLLDDPRFSVKDWHHKRHDVYLLSGWDSKKAGDLANKIYKDNNFTWMNYKDHKFNYSDMAEGSDFHYELITRAIREKIKQNPGIKKLLMQTTGLILRPDHTIKDGAPASYKYHEILMKIRSEL